MKLMQAFKIEIDYQKHRQRLTLIKSLDTKKKLSISTSKNVDRINSYKKTKSNSLFYHDFSKQKQLCQQNEMLHRTLSKVYARDPTQKINKKINQQHHLALNRSTSQSTVRSHASSRIKQENSLINKKLSMAKSSYRKFREERPRKRVITETGHRKQVIKLLQFQLGCKPQVLFPTLRNRTEKEKRPNNSSRK